MKDSNSINVHLNDVRQVPAARSQILNRTGEEPIICLHLYLTDLGQLLELAAKLDPRTTIVEQIISNGAAKLRGFGEPIESEELKHAREMVEKWSAHSTQYASEQRALWQRKVRELQDAEDGADAPEDDTPDAENDATPEEEGLLSKCMEIIRQEKKASTSLFQRRLRLGYTRAARLMELLEERGVIAPAEAESGTKPRRIL